MGNSLFIFKIYKLEFLFFLIAFIAFTIIGTVSHELGHYVVAKIKGFESSLHFAYVNWSGNSDSRIDNFWISFGGPFQTMAFGITAFFLLLHRRFKAKSLNFSLMDWILVFFSLFWLRQVFNLFSSAFFKILGENESYFGGDEVYLSSELGLPPGFLSLLTAGFGLIICLYIWLSLIPKKYRVTFFLSGIIGSGLGWWLWIEQLGPYLMP